MPDSAQLLVIAKSPVPGRVKTRLTPAFTARQAAALAEAALRDTVRVVMQTGAADRTVFLDGEPGAWLEAGLRVVPQRGKGLDERLAAAFDDAWEHLQVPMLLIGMDTPQLTTTLLDTCIQQLLTSGVDAALGLAADGGWWCLGLRRPHRDALLGVPMSLATTGAIQLQCLQENGLRVSLLPHLRDVDTAADAEEVATMAPTTRFASVWRSMVATDVSIR